jgi:hypothetical protein
VSKLDPFKATIAEWLEKDPTVAGTVIEQRLRPLGYSGGSSILHDYLQKVRQRPNLSVLSSAWNRLRASDLKSAGVTLALSTIKGTNASCMPLIWLKHTAVCCIWSSHTARPSKHSSGVTFTHSLPSVVSLAKLRLILFPGRKS